MTVGARKKVRRIGGRLGERAGGAKIYASVGGHSRRNGGLGAPEWGRGRNVRELKEFRETHTERILPDGNSPM